MVIAHNKYDIYDVETKNKTNCLLGSPLCLPWVVPLGYSFLAPSTLFWDPGDSRLSMRMAPQPFSAVVLFP